MPKGRVIKKRTGLSLIRFWPRTGILTLKGHTDFVNSVSFSPDGERIVSGSNDKTVKIWDVSALVKPK